MNDLSGTMIKGYELRERIGAGGFGAVYRAFQSSVGREVAIKIILPHFASHPDFIRRFETEAQLVARLEHPFIVPLYDYWRDPEGAYLVMRWLRNGSLREALRECPYDLPSAARLLDQISSALATAHRNQVIHRDLKPANILLDEDGNAYLADFGIAKDLMNMQGGSTQADMVVGSPDYLAPEQARSEQVTPQTDIYSLGITLYEVLSGQHPFPDVTPVERMYKHLNEPVPLLLNLPPDVAPRVNDFLQKATAKNPAHRYSDVLAMAVAFREVIGLIPERSSANVVELLTQREQSVLQCIIAGRSNKEIAEELFITVATVKWYIKQIYSKLNVRSRVQAIVRARELHLITSGVSTDSAASDISVLPSEQFVPENPYKGLRAFQSADFHDFFGREIVTEKLLKRFNESGDFARFLVVVGPSGSGKSSLVKAGLIPALWQGKLPGSERWFVVEMLPGAHPLDELEIALTRIAANQSGNLHEQLARDDRGLVRVAQLILPNDGSELVLVIDQFEEAFTLVNEEPARLHFLELLTKAVTEPHSRVRVVITLRADFYDRPLHYAAFGELVRSRMETVLPLSASELEQAIARPAEQMGVHFESGLITAIVGDVNYQPGALPLLQYALTELFERRQGHVLTQDAYRTIGGTVGALARRADEVYEELEANEQEIVRQMFLRLVTLGEGSEDTRRRVPRSELLALTTNSEMMDDLIDTYASYRLLSLDNDPGTRSPTVEIAHEAMLREWGRLHEWLIESRNDVRTQRQLAAAAVEWYLAQRDASFLLRGSHLEQFAGWAADSDLVLTPKERAYLDASLAEWDQQATDERARQARELKLAQDRAIADRRAANRLRYLAGVLVIFLVVAAGLSLLALQSRDSALKNFNVSESERLIASVRELSAAAIANLSVDPERSILLALQAVKTSTAGGNPVLIEAQDALHRAVEASRVIASLRGHNAPIFSLAVSPDGKRLATTGDDGTVKVWDLVTNKEWLSIPTGLAKADLQSANAVFTPDGTKLLLVSAENTATVWDISTATAAGKPLMKLSGPTGNLLSVAVSPDGKHFATSSDDNTATLWDAATGQQLLNLKGHESPSERLAFSPDGTRLYSGSDGDGKAIAWDTSTGKVVLTVSGQGKVFGVDALAISPDGTRLATGEFDTTLRIWDTATGNLLFTLFGHSSQIMGAAFSPDGREVASVSEDGTAKLWDALTGQELLTLAGHTSGVLAVAFSPDGKRLYTASRDGTIKIWDISPTAGSDWLNLAGHQDRVFSVMYSPDGKRLATWSFDNTVKVWDAANGKELLNIVLDNSTVGGDAFYSPDGKRLAVVSGTYVKVFDSESGVELLSIGPVAHDLYGVLYSPDGNQLATASSDGTIGLYNSMNGTKIFEFTTSAQIRDFAFSPDGKRIATANVPDINVWNAVTGQKLVTFTGHGGVPTSGVVFSPDGKRIASSGNDSVIRVWDSETGKEVFALVGHTGSAFGVAFSPDGQYLASSSVDRTVKLWKLPHEGETVEVPLTLYGNTAAVYRVAFSPDGQYLATAGRNTVGRIYSLRINDLIAVANKHLTRTLTLNECQTFLHSATCPASP